MVNKNQHCLLEIKEHLIRYQDIICKTTISIQKYKVLDLFGANETNGCIKSLEECHVNIERVLLLIKNKTKSISNNKIIKIFETIKKDLEIILKTFGTENLTELLYILAFDIKI